MPQSARKSQRIGRCYGWERTRSAHETRSAIPVRKQTRGCHEPHRIVFRADLGTSRSWLLCQSRGQFVATELRLADLAPALPPRAPLAVLRFRTLQAHRTSDAFLPER